MTISINGTVIDKWQNLAVTTMYNSIASTFSFDIYWDPQDKTMRPVMLPGYYQECVVKADNGEVLITGVVHSPSFHSEAKPSLKNISGYSRTGVLDDCEYSAVFPNGSQNLGKTLYTIVQEVADYFGFGPVQDNTRGASDATITKTDADVDDKCTEYLREICKELNVTLSHNAKGQLVLGVLDKKNSSTFDFKAGMPGIKYDLQFDGQAMHDEITVKSQGGQTAMVTVKNPYVLGKPPAKNTGQKEQVVMDQTGTQVFQFRPTQSAVFSAARRPGSYVQSETNGDLTKFASRKLAEELQHIGITIYVHGWTVGGKILRPDTLITLQNDELYLFYPAKLFIRQVDYSADEKQDTCVLQCVIPECFSGEDFTVVTPINIFTNKGNNTIFTPDPQSALQSGFIGQNNLTDL